MSPEAISPVMSSASRRPKAKGFSPKFNPVWSRFKLAMANVSAVVSLAASLASIEQGTFLSCSFCSHFCVDARARWARSVRLFGRCRASSARAVESLARWFASSKQADASHRSHGCSCVLLPTGSELDLCPAGWSGTEECHPAVEHQQHREVAFNSC